MSVPNLDSSRQNSNRPQQDQQLSQDRLDRWQFRLFKIILFIIAVWAMLKFLNEHVPIVEGVRWVLHKLR